MQEKDLLPLFRKHKKVCTDTRNIIPGSIFFALRGENFNGNEFVLDALQKGCLAAVSDDPQHKEKDARIVLVDDSLKALQDLARSYRDTLSIPVLGITGSNGKTTSKELIRDVLAKKYKILATKGNLNNHIGVPLTLLEIQEDTEFAIIEMGANHQGEIKLLASIADPDYGFITNIGLAHLEGFGGPEGVKKGKKELFDHLISKGGKLFVNGSLEHLMEISERADRILFGLEDSKHTFKIEEPLPTISVRWSEKGERDITIPTRLTGEYNLGNVAAAAVIGNYFGVEKAQIIDSISNYKPENNRSQLEKGKFNEIILDAYNANPNSMASAIENLSRAGKSKALAVLGEMKELGEYTPSEHKKILQLLKSLDINSCLIGEAFLRLSSEFSEFSYFKNTAEAIKYFSENPVKEKLVLLKGSRALKLESLSDCF